MINPNQSYTFSKIYELRMQVDDICQYYGYSFSKKKLSLSLYEGELEGLTNLRERIEEVLPRVILSNETSRREILISPILMELLHYTDAQLRIEYPLSVSEQLQGYLDYYLFNHQKLVIIEAKKGDLDNGFNQLSVELIAMDQWPKTGEQPFLIGSVTNGSLWQFGRLNREKKEVEQGLETYRIPDELEPLMRILVQALMNT